MTKDGLENQGTIHAKRGANTGAEEAPVHCNTSAEWAKVRCNDLSKKEGVCWALERGFRHKNYKKKVQSNHLLGLFLVG